MITTKLESLFCRRISFLSLILMLATATICVQLGAMVHNVSNIQGLSLILSFSDVLVVRGVAFSRANVMRRMRTRKLLLIIRLS